MFGRQLILWICGVLAATPALGGYRVVLVTGEVLLAEAIERADNAVSFNHPLLGAVTLDHDAIARIDELGDADTHRQAPEPGAEAGTGASATVRGDAASEPDPEPIGLFGTRLLRGWNTNLSFGLSGSSGNTDRQSFTGQFTTHQRNDRHRTLFEAMTFYSVSEGDTTQNESRVRLTRDWLLPESKWFLFANGEYEYDQQRDFENRVSGFGGVGYAFVDTDDWEILGRAGAGATYEFGQINELKPEALFGGSVFKWAINRHHNLAASATFYPDLEQGGESRFNVSLDWIIDLPDTSGLKLKLGLVNDYESNTRGDDEHNDLKYYTALVLAF